MASVFPRCSVIRAGETTQRCMNVVERCQFYPVAVIEGTGGLATEAKVARVGVGAVRRAIVADVAGAFGVAAVVVFDKVGFNWRPDDAAVKT